MMSPGFPEPRSDLSSRPTVWDGPLRSGEILKPAGQRFLGAADARDGALGNFPLTEHGTAVRLIAKHAGDLRFIPELGAWLIWQDGRWEWDHTGSEIRQLTVSLTDDIYTESRQAGDEAKHFTSWARRLQSLNVTKQIVAFAADIREVRSGLAAVDSDPLLVGLHGGRKVLDLKSGGVRQAVRDDLITRSLEVERLGDSAMAKRWVQFLGEVFENDEEIIDWIQRYLGYALSGLVCEQLFVFLCGSGSNGKSVFLSFCQRLWLSYARTIQAETLMSQLRPGTGATPDLARLAGARLVSGSETEEGRALSESLIKQLTGGDRVAARHLYGEPFEFSPVLKLMLVGNHRPKIKGTDDAIWRRIHLVGFNRSFAPSERDPRLGDALWAEREHVTAWIVEGFQRYQARGLADVPRSIHAATEAYRADEDIVGQWIAERTTRGGESLSAALYADYRLWCDTHGHALVSSKALGQNLQRRGFVSSHSRLGTLYKDIGLRSVML